MVFFNVIFNSLFIKRYDFVGLEILLFEGDMFFLDRYIVICLLFRRGDSYLVILGCLCYRNNS